MVQAAVRGLHKWRTPLLIVLAIALLVVAALLGGGWYYADSLKNGALKPNHDPDEPDLEVVAIDDGRVTLRTTSRTKEDGDWDKDGIFGLEWKGGYDQVGAILHVDDHQVVREFIPIRSHPQVGEQVRLDSFAFRDDPQQAHGIPF